MSDYKEKYEKMRVAGKLAAQTLDMLTDNIKEGVTTDYIDKEYYNNYLIAKKAGVNFLAYRCDISSKKIFIDKKLKIIDD